MFKFKSTPGNEVFGLDGEILKFDKNGFFETDNLDLANQLKAYGYTAETSSTVEPMRLGPRPKKGK
jgi:hypothetical protein